MKTKIIIMTAVIAAMVLIPAAFGQEEGPGRPVRQGAERPGQAMREGAERPGAAAPMAELLQDLTPEQRARVREFVQGRLQEQRQRLQDRMRQQAAEPQGRALAQREFAERGQVTGPQGRAFARREAPERGVGPMQRPFRGEGRMEGRFEGRAPRECPCCGHPMAQGAQGRFARQQGFAGRSGYGPQARPFRGRGWQRLQDEDAAGPRFEGRGMGGGPGLQPFEADAVPERRRPQAQQEDGQARPRLRRNAQ